uniref:Uncharacterized protein n=1 Tax=Clytia hemisphaerica TaxID=252671 RepID=A0A7M5X0N6_9CNID
MESLKIQGLEIVVYNIEKHSGEVQKLLDEYLVPTYYKRMGITQDERLKYAHIEDILHPNLAKDPKFNKFSLVAVEKDSGEVVALGLSYLITKQEFQEDFVDLNKRISNDQNYSPEIRKYCQHRYAVCHPILEYYDKFGIDELIYLEDVVTTRKYRGLGVHVAIMGVAFEKFGHEYGFLSEGMVPVEKFITEKKFQNHEWSPIGTWVSDRWYLVNKQFSYDGYICPVFISGPVPKSKL